MDIGTWALCTSDRILKSFCFPRYLLLNVISPPVCMIRQTSGINKLWSVKAHCANWMWILRGKHLQMKAPGMKECSSSKWGLYSLTDKLNRELMHRSVHVHQRTMYRFPSVVLASSATVKREQGWIAPWVTTQGGSYSASNMYHPLWQWTL